MSQFYIASLSVYFITLLILSFYGTHRYMLAYLYFKNKKHRPKFSDLKIEEDELPLVTVQLPIYNEQYVVERLIDAVCALDYPNNKLEIQVLDDSDDDTIAIASTCVNRYRSLGIDIHYIQREDRSGYKAGALEAGQQIAKGDLLAIFDADFIPEKDFLRKMVPFLHQDEKVGMVQARWDHINRDYSLLTQAQAIFLDGHFVIEHAARNWSGRFFNFNGTAGIWRKECIVDAGGWEHDTLTEDLDLSYRAQMKGWKFLFVPDVLAPAELPVTISAFKSQQHRWAKGSIQVGKKLLGRIIKSDLPFQIKKEAFVHLTNNISYLLMVLLSVLMPISLLARLSLDWEDTLWLDIPFFITATFSVFFFYALSQSEIGFLKKKFYFIPFNLALGIGLSVSNGKAVLEALCGQESGFARTPKFGIEKKKDNWSNKKYHKNYDWVGFFELLLASLYGVTFFYAWQEGLYASLPFLSLFLVGYSYVAFLSVFQQIPRLTGLFALQDEFGLDVKIRAKNS